MTLSDPAPIRETIHVEYVTWPAVGHMVEALAVANRYRRANPDAEIHLTVNAATATELATCCPWLTALHTVEVPNPGPVDKASFPKAPVDPRPSLRFELPEDSRARAVKLVPGGTQIAITPAGAGRRMPYPSTESWSRILEALADRFPNLTVHLIGKLSKEGHPNTTAVSRADIEFLLERHRFCRDRFDIGLLDQLAVIERCGVLISPHTGFAFGALAVGTPWLTISDGRWPEFFHTGTPFYSLLPDRRGDMSDRRITELLPELLDAAAGLIEHRWSFWQCYHRHRRRCARLYGNRRSRALAFARQVAHPFTKYAA